MILSRIIRTDEVDPKTLIPHPLNLRVHPTVQQKSLTALLDHLGWLRRIIVNENTGHVINGHLRLKAALEREVATVPVAYVDLSEDEELRVLALFDAVGELAVTNAAKLTAILDRITPSDSMLDVTERLRKEAGLDFKLMPPVIDDAEQEYSSGVLVRFGEFRIIVSESEFTTWRDSLFDAVGMAESVIIAEIKRRIKDETVS